MNALLASAARAPRHPRILFARYVPRAAGERLAGAGVNFVDRVGNLHLRLGDNQTLLLGRTENRRQPEARRTGPAAIQLYCAFLVDPESVSWPARRLAIACGAGKTAAAEARQRLISAGILHALKDGTFAVADRKALEDRFLQGYEQILRPHLMLGRYRSALRRPDAFIARVKALAAGTKVRWALTGFAGAFALDRYYRSEDVQLFWDSRSLAPDIQRDLQLLPDRRGPITLFRFFGDIVLYRGRRPKPVAHTWLIYAELLSQGDPRAIEAAAELRENWLE